MPYIEFLRSRRLLIWWSAILFSSFMLTAITAATHNLLINGNVGPIPVNALVSIVFFGGVVLASFVAPGLHAEHTTLALVWTRPVARSITAWRYIGVDLATILTGIVVLSVIIVAQMAAAGLAGHLAVADDTLFRVVLALGCIIMWYGLVMLAAVRFPERAGMIAGLSWLAFSVVIIFASVPNLWPIVHAIGTVLIYIDPLAYFGSSGTVVANDAARHGTAASQPVGAIAPPLARLVLSYAIGIGALAATVRLWSKREI